MARLIVTVHQGMAVMHRAGVSIAQLRATARLTCESFDDAGRPIAGLRSHVRLHPVAPERPLHVTWSGDYVVVKRRHDGNLVLAPGVLVQARPAVEARARLPSRPTEMLDSLGSSSRKDETLGEVHPGRRPGISGCAV